MRVIVIGGGVIGTTTAYFLAGDGHEVTLVDRADTLAADGSFSNGGMLHASHTEPWNTPDAIRQLLRWIGREDSPLLLRPSQLPNLVGWGLGFLRYSRPHRHRHSTRVNTRLAVYSQQVMRALRDSTGIAYDDDRRGILKIFREERALDQAAAGSRLVADLGVPHQVLDTEGVLRLEPVLADVRQELAGGIFYPNDETGDAALFTRRLGELAGQRGVALRLGTAVRHIAGGPGGVEKLVTDQGELRADRYVLAAGAEAAVLARPLGLRLPIRPVKGYSATLEVAGLEGAPRTPIIDDARKVVMARLGSRLRIAGTAEFAGFDRRVNPRRVGSVVDQALASLPRLAAAVDRGRVSPWACLRPMTMDGPPILGATPVPNLFLNTGPGHLGWTFAAGSARVVADLVGGRSPEIDLDGLTIERYRSG